MGQNVGDHIVREGLRPTENYTVEFLLGKCSLGALPNKSALILGHGKNHRAHHLPNRGRRVNAEIQGDNLPPLALRTSHHLSALDDRPGQPIQFRHDQHVSLVTVEATHGRLQPLTLKSHRGRACALTDDLDIPAATVSLSLDYAASARLGQWMQITPRVIKAGRSMGFVDALVTGDGETIARASATFRAVE